MMEIDSVPKPKRMDDFSNMSAGLDSIEQKLEKKLKHEERVKQHYKSR